MNTQPKSYPIAASYAPLIARARVYDVAIESPLDRAPRLSARLGHDVLLKREDLQAVFSFKLRGAYNKIAQTPRQQARERRDLQLGRQPCARRGARGAPARATRRHRDAEDDALDQGGRRRRARRRSRAARPHVRRRQGARARARSEAGACASCTRSTIPTSSRVKARSARSSRNNGRRCPMPCSCPSAAAA